MDVHVITLQPTKGLRRTICSIIWNALFPRPVRMALLLLYGITTPLVMEVRNLAFLTAKMEWRYALHSSSKVSRKARKRTTSPRLTTIYQIKTLGMVVSKYGAATRWLIGESLLRLMLLNSRILPRKPQLSFITTRIQHRIMKTYNHVIVLGNQCHSPLRGWNSMVTFILAHSTAHLASRTSPPWYSLVPNFRH